MATTKRAAERPAKRRGPIPYEEYTVGITWDEIRAELAEEQRRAYEAGQYMFVSRRTVLGRMHQRKREAYEAYLRERKRRAARKRARRERRAVRPAAPRLWFEAGDDGLPF